ncbi:hypothetical protein ASC82_14915 [Streptomyces sp. Root431]|nr:hypothetical protein ASC82_14915 [Streptomyces sp. Root431]
MLARADMAEWKDDGPARHHARPEDQIKRQCVPRRGRLEDVAALMAFLSSVPKAAASTRWRRSR